MWKKLTSNFKNFLKIERNLSDNTIINYLFDLEKLQTFLKKSVRYKSTKNKSIYFKKFCLFNF